MPVTRGSNVSFRHAVHSVWRLGGAESQRQAERAADGKCMADRDFRLRPFNLTALRDQCLEGSLIPAPNEHDETLVRLQSEQRRTSVKAGRAGVLEG